MITVNLLPDSILQLRRQQHIKRLGVMWVGILAVALAIVAGVMLTFMIFSMRQRDEAQATNTQTQQKVDSPEERQKRQQVLAVKTSVDALARMLGNQRQFTVYLGDLEQNLPTNVWLRSMSLNNRNEFQIEGRTRGGYADIATYLARLRSKPSLFNNVTLFSANNVSVDEFGFNLSGIYQGGLPPEIEDSEDNTGAESNGGESQQNAPSNNNEGEQ